MGTETVLRLLTLNSHCSLVLPLSQVASYLISLYCHLVTVSCDLSPVPSHTTGNPWTLLPGEPREQARATVSQEVFGESYFDAFKKEVCAMGNRGRQGQRRQSQPKAPSETSQAGKYHLLSSFPSGPCPLYSCALPNTASISILSQARPQTFNSCIPTKAYFFIRCMDIGNPL